MARPSTSLRRKTLRAVGRLVLGMGVVVLLPLAALLAHSFHQLEDQEARKDFDRAVNAVHDQVAELGRIARDYGTWDATWAFAGGEGAADYLAVNYVDATFAQNGLSLLVLTDRRGILFARAFDRERGAVVPVPPEVTEKPELFVNMNDQDGLLALAGGPLLVGTSPILPSNGAGEPRGQLVVGRWLDAAHVARLGRTTRLHLAVEPPWPGPPEAPEVHRVADDHLVIVGPLLGLDGTPAARLAVQLERTVWAEGRQAVLLLLGAMALIALALLWSLRRLLQRLVLRRLDAVAQDVRRIRDEHDPTLRVTDQGGDELGLLGLAINEMLDALRRLNQLLVVEQDKSERLLLNVLPRAIAERLKGDHQTIADAFTDVSVLFADLTEFTRYSAHVSAVELVNLLDDLFTQFDALAEQHGLEKIKTIGDSYLVVGGLPEPGGGHAHAICAMALGMHAALVDFNARHGTPFHLRIGIHCGPVVAGVIGRQKFIYDIWGDTVNTASRLESHGLPDAVQISAALAERVADRFVVAPRGVIELKGKGPFEAWWLVAARSERPPAADPEADPEPPAA